MFITLNELSTGFILEIINQFLQCDDWHLRFLIGSLNGEEEFIYFCLSLIIMVDVHKSLYIFGVDSISPAYVYKPRT